MRKKIIECIKFFHGVFILKLSKEKNTVSVLLSTYNGNMFIEEQVVSIVKQNFTKFNIIIRDDGSKKTNLEFIKDISNKYNVPIVVDKKINRNLGTVKSYNRLLYETQSDYICFSDQDDVWKRDKLLNSFNRIKLLEKEHGKHTPILVHTDLSVCDNNLCKIHPSFINYQKLDPAKKSLNYLLVQNNVTACTIMINRALKEIASPIPEKACVHDWWLALVASLFGEIDFINMPTVSYRQHDKNQIGASKYGAHHFMYRLKK